MDESEQPKLVSRRHLLGALATGTAGFAGCQNSADGGTPTLTPVAVTPTTSPTATEEQPLEVLHGRTGGAGAEAMDALTGLFAERYPDVPAEFDAVSDNYDTVPGLRLRNGHPPGSFSTRAGGRLDRYADSLTAVDDAWAETGLDAALPDAVAERCHLDGAPRHLPVESFRTNVLAYNVSVVEAAGVDPDSLSSVPALLDALAAIDRETDATPLAHSTEDPWTTLQLWTQVFLATAGPDAYRAFVDGDGDRAAVETAVSRVGDLLEFVPDDARELHYIELVDRVTAGTAAAIPMGSWVLGEFANASSFAYGTDWDWVAFPGTAGQYVTVLDGFVVPSDNPKPAAARTWARFLAGRDAQVTASTPDRGSVPPRTDVDTANLPTYAADVWTDMADAAAYPPSLAQGLAVPPAQVTACEDAVGAHVVENFDAAAAAEALLAAVSG